MKEYLYRIHPAFVCKNIDTYPSIDSPTIGTGMTIKRLIRIGKIQLSKEQKRTVLKCKKIRDRIEHSHFEISEKEAKAIIGRMLSFIFSFSKEHLNVDFEQDFRADDRWDSLIEIYEFMETHIKVIEQQLESYEGGLIECPSCGGNTFKIDEEMCAFCGYEDELVSCEYCDEVEFLSDANAIPYDDGESIVYMCSNCIDEANQFEP